MKTKKFYLLAIFLPALVILNQSCKKDASSHVDGASADNGVEKALINGLVAWYTFDGDLLDHSGNNNNVSLMSGATATAGKKGIANTAYYFNGSAYMTVENSPSLNPPNQITMGALIKPTGYYLGQCHSNRILSKGYTDAWQGRYDLGYDDMAFWNYLGCNETVRQDRENFYGSYGDGQASASGVTDLTNYIKAGHWYTLIYTYDGVNSKLYVNGVLRASVAKTTTFTANTQQLFIGRHEDPNFPYYFTGIIDEIRIYSKALNISAVQQLNQVLQSNQ